MMIWLVAVVVVSAMEFAATQLPRNASPQSVPSRIKLLPRLTPGEVMRYTIEFHTESAMQHGGAIQDPQGPAQLAVTWNATVRLEILGATNESGPVQQSGPAAMRVRTTYEKSSATVRSDTPDPDADGIRQQYARLEGKSIEFTLGGNGAVSGVRGLEGVIPDEKARSAAEQWIAQLSGAVSAPAAGIIPGQRWTSEQLADSMPLAGLAWRTDSTYLRNEPCQPASPGGAPAVASSDFCAVILSQLSLVSKRTPKDPTPDEFRRNGLRTSGRWTGSGESLSYVSLRTGWVVSTNQNGAEQMDIAVTKTGGNSVRYAGTVRTRSSISLEPRQAALTQ